MTARADTIEDRLALFWEKVDVRGPNECWLWTAALGSNGYGCFATGNGRSCRAHRWLWEQTYGPIPEEQVLHHTCEERRCMNLAHMELLDSQGEHVRLHGFGGDWRAKYG